MRATLVAAAVVGVSLTGIAAPVSAAPAGQAADVAHAVVVTFYKQTPSQRRNVCRVWRTQPVALGKRMVRAMVRVGYSRRPAARGIVAGMVSVCGTPYGYEGTSA